MSIALVRSLVEAVMRAGFDAGGFLREVGLEADLLADADARVPNRKFDQLMCLALDWTGDPAFGLRMGEQASLAGFDVVGYLSFHAQTVGEAVAVFAKYFRILCDLQPPELVEDGDSAMIVFHFPRTQEHCDRARAEFCLARLAILARNVLGVSARAREICFEHEAPFYTAEYERVFGPTVRFGQPATGVKVQRSLLDRPLLHGNPQLYRVLEEQADRRLRTLHEPDSVSAAIQDLVIEQGGQVDCDMESLAQRLGMSARTLRRRLAQEGRSFNSVLGDAMAMVAKRLLREPRASIQEVSYQMGFADVSSFHRAFKRWTGVTPGQYLGSLV